MSLRRDAQKIIDAAITAALPDTAVKKALKGVAFPDGKLVLVAIGKAAWSMSKAACELLADRISDGVVITKYDHAQGICPRSGSLKRDIQFPMRTLFPRRKRRSSLFKA